MSGILFVIQILLDESQNEDVLTDGRSSGARTSPVWDFYVIHQDTDGVDSHATCKRCGTRISLKTTSPTGNLTKHLNVHGIKVADRMKRPKSSLSQRSIQDFVKKKVEPMTAAEKAAQDLKLTKLVCEEFLPFHIVNKESFIEYSKGLNPSYVLPDRRNLSKNLVPNLAGNIKKEISEDLEGALFVSISMDGWTSRITENYAVVNVHYINKNWEMKTACLDCS